MITYIVESEQVGREILQFSDNRMVVRLVWDIKPHFANEKQRSAADVGPAHLKIPFKWWNNVILAVLGMVYVGFQIFRERFDEVPRRVRSGNLERALAEPADRRRQ